MDAGCAAYRSDMMLLALRRRLTDPQTPEGEHEAIRCRIREIEAATGLDDDCAPEPMPPDP